MLNAANFMLSEPTLSTVMLSVVMLSVVPSVCRWSLRSTPLQGASSVKSASVCETRSLAIESKSVSALG